eukprot:m.237375 g.237375  ORF g.237375 m.237375 type:complete len:81 (+) comp15792_c0_seq7:889-1131(+)
MEWLHTPCPTPEHVEISNLRPNESTLAHLDAHLGESDQIVLSTARDITYFHLANSAVFDTAWCANALLSVAALRWRCFPW